MTLLTLQLFLANPVYHLGGRFRANPGEQRFRLQKCFHTFADAEPPQLHVTVLLTYLYLHTFLSALVCCDVSFQQTFIV